MTLQQLKYVITVSECGSITSAAARLLISQPSLSKAISDLEKEMNTTIFYREKKGVSLSEEGSKFLSYARQVVEQAELLEEQFRGKRKTKRVFAISAQHYAFVVNAFVALVEECGNDKYEFTLRESKTYDIIEDVRTSRSELGVLYLSHFNREVMLRMIANADLRFETLFYAKPHVFVSRSNPLAEKKQVTLEDLKDYTRLTYEQGIHNSFYYSEELHSTEDSPKSIVVTDRATLFNLLIGLNGYTISSGVLSEDLNGDQIVSVSLVSEEVMEIGYVVPKDRPLSMIGERYLRHLRDYIGYCSFSTVHLLHST